MLRTVISLNIPPKLKNGKLLYKNTLIGFFNKNDSINITNIPINETSSLVNPLLKPKSAPNPINTIITISTMFILSPNIIIL